MKIHPTREWCERSAEIEGNSSVGAGCPPLPCSEIFSTETKPNDGEQVVCIRADGWWEKGTWYARFDGWMVNGMRQDIKFWMRVHVPNDESCHGRDKT